MKNINNQSRFNIQIDRELEKQELENYQLLDQFRLLVENTSDWIWEVNENAIYTYVSPKIRELLGFEPEEIIGKTPFDLMPLEEAERVRQLFSEILSNRRPFYLFENENIHKEGHRILLETSGVPIFDANGNFRGYRGIDRNITSHKRTASVLRSIVNGTSSATGKDFLNSLVRHLARVLNMDFVILGELIKPGGDKVRSLAFWAKNDYAENFEYDLTGTPCENVAGQSLCSYPCGVQALFPEDLYLVEMEAESYTGVPLFSSDGSPLGILAALDSKPMKDVHFIESILSIFASRAASELERRKKDELMELYATDLKQANLQLKHEIYERKRMEDELIKVQKLESLGVFAGGIAHDFNNLLQTIINCISVAKMHASESLSIDMLKDAETASRYASHLSHRLLTFAKGGSPVKKVTSISHVIEEAISLSLSGSSIFCESVIQDGLHSVEIDVGQINQVFTNLFINAKEAMPYGGKIIVSAANLAIGENEQPFLEKGDYVRISVEDHGTGIQEENLIKIFDPYFSTKARGAEKGTGLGLSVCHSIIMKHGGLITVESKPGSGSTFHVFLPASTKQQVKEEKRRKEKGPSGGRVLFMEDEKNMWASTRLLFKVMGYEVQFVMNGHEAISLYSEMLETGKPFDGVILDLTIPGGMGGKETMKLLREIDQNVRAIVISGYAEDPVMTNFRQFGFVHALAKPYTIEQLKAAVWEGFA